MEIIDGNIFNCKENIIVHQTNCQGVMGHGIAAQVKERYPEVFRGYYHYCKTQIPEEILGTSLICEANDGKTNERDRRRYRFIITSLLCALL